MKLNWKTISIRKKIIIMGLIIIFLLSILTFAYMIPTVRSTMIQMKKEKISEIVTAAVNMLNFYDKKVRDKELKLAEAQDLAMNSIRDIRYGADGNEYLWINDFQPKVIMHPINMNLEGKDVSDYRDKAGTAMFKNFVKVCKESGEGFVDYMWQKPNDPNAIVPKISFVKSFKQWNWIIGTGIYIEDVQKDINSVIRIMVGLIAAIFGLSIFIILILSRTISEPIALITNRLKNVSKGDLTVQITAETGDEMGDLVNNFNTIIENIKNVIRDIQGYSEQMATASEEMNATTESFTENAQNQAATAEEITATVEEISAGMDNVANGADEQLSKLNELISMISNLSSLIRRMGTNITETQALTNNITQEAKRAEDSMKSMNNSISKIRDSSKEMVGIVNIITDISEQINLLSLNAAIEAARAGDMGLGFAVVADEISKLADQTAKSIKDIDRLIRGNEEEMGRGMTDVNQTFENMSTILDGVNSIDQKMNVVYAHMEEQIKTSDDVTSMTDVVRKRAEEIKNATDEQKVAVAEIVKSISNINELTQANASGSEEMSANAKDVSDTAEQLKHKVEYFRIA